ncbi:MAG: hypothetical protein R6U04_10695 [Bacteroidales bacterium]
MKTKILLLIPILLFSFFYCANKDREILERLKYTVKVEGLDNVVPVIDQSEALNIELENETIDVILFHDVLHYIEKAKRKIISRNNNV